MTADPVTVIAEALTEYERTCDTDWPFCPCNVHRAPLAEAVVAALLAAGLLPQGPGPTAAAECEHDWYDDGIRRTCQDCRAKEPGFSFVDPQHGGRAVVPPSPVPPSPTEQDDNLAALEALNLDKADISNGNPVPIRTVILDAGEAGFRRGLAAARNAVARVMKPEFAPHYTNDNEPKLSNWNQAVTNSLKQIDALLPAPTVEPADERRSE